MYESNIKKLITKLSTINKLEDPINNSYQEILEGIEIAEDYDIDFTFTLSLTEDDFFINIKEIDEKSKNIRKYAIGLKDRKKVINKLRHDDVNHHNDNANVKKFNPPHHKHEGEEEIVKGFSGNIDDLVEDFKNILD